jgi:hypothetical protein
VAILTIASVLLGTVFGRFFKVWALVPACALTFAIVFASSAFYEHDLPSALLEFTVIAACLQIGYASACLACVIRDGWRRLKIPGESPHPAATSIVATRHLPPDGVGAASFDPCHPGAAGSVQFCSDPTRDPD